MPVLTRRRPQAGHGAPVRAALVPAATRTLGLVAVLVCAGIAGAAPAVAVDDPTRPDARVTHGPSCRPGGVVVEVTGGAVAYAVTLATARRPAGEAVAEVGPGAVVVLSTGDVDWGETIDPLLEYVALDGSGTVYVDELEGYSFTRPTAEDCAAIAAPPAGGTVPSPGTHSQTPPVGLPAPAEEAVPMPVPGLPTPSDVAPAAVDAVPQEAATRTPLLDGGVAWPVLAGGVALLAAGAGLAAVSGRRGSRSQASPPCGPPPPGSA